MGLLSGAIDTALQGIGSSLLSTGEWFIEAGYTFWKSCSDVTLGYVKKNPMSVSNAWGTVTGNIYNIALAIAASLAVLFFVIGWLRESIDIRNTFTLENMFRFFIRYMITASLIVNSLSVVTGISECATAVVSTMSVSIQNEQVTNLFDDMKQSLENDEADGGTYLAFGLTGMVGGFFGGAVIIVCGISLVLAVMSRLFKILLCIPFAPVAFSGFAGGAEMAQMGIAWLRTFVGYCLEAIVIGLSISISFGLFRDASLFSVTSHSDATVINMILLICNYCMPMITACACVKGAELTVRRCLGLG